MSFVPILWIISDVMNARKSSKPLMASIGTSVQSMGQQSKSRVRRAERRIYHTSLNVMRAIGCFNMKMIWKIIEGEITLQVNCWEQRWNCRITSVHIVVKGIWRMMLCECIFWGCVARKLKTQSDQRQSQRARMRRNQLSMSQRNQAY